MTETCKYTPFQSRALPVKEYIYLGGYWSLNASFLRNVPKVHYQTPRQIDLCYKQNGLHTENSREWTVVRDEKCKIAPDYQKCLPMLVVTY